MTQTMAIWTLICLLLVTETNTQNHDQFVLKTYRDLCPYSSTCTLPPKLEFPYNNQQLIPCCLPCFCGPNCLETNSCCPDASNSSMLQDPGKTTECLSVAHPVEDDSNDGFYSKFKRYNTIRTCPSTYNQTDVRLMCTRHSPETLDEHTFVSDEAGNIYRNRHCALCNGVVKYTQWNMLVQCRFYVENLVRKLSKEILEMPHCKTWSEAPSHISLPIHSRCYLTKYGKCSITGKWKTRDSNIDKACSTGQYAPFVQHQIVFKNVFCAYCNNDHFNVDHILNNACSNETIRAPLIYPITVIVDSKAVSSTENQRAKCMISKIYDKYSDQCRTLICPSNSIPKYGTCLRAFKATDGLAIAFEVLLTSPTYFQTTMNDLRLATEALNNMIEKRNCRVCYNVMHQNTTKQNLVLTAKIYLVTSSRCPERKILNVAKMLNTNTLLLNINSTNNYTFAMELVSKNSDRISSENVPGFTYFKKICSLPPLHISDLQCPRIEISGLDYTNALRKNYIKPSHHYDQYIIDEEDKNLWNITFEICIDEYFSSSGGSRVGETYGNTYTILNNRDIMLMFTVLNVWKYLHHIG